jgi:hypothetical protein
MKHVAKSTGNQEMHQSCESCVRVGLFITKDQLSYYNTVIALNYLSCQYSTQSVNNQDYYIINLLLDAPTRCRHVWMPMRRPPPSCQ